MDLNDSVLEHLRAIGDLPDLEGTHYILEQEIGRGGMGVVYAAHDRDLNRRVALKVLDPAFAEEARLIARLEHPAVVPVYEAGFLADGRSFYAMKLTAGQRLDRYADEPASQAERVRVIRRIAEVLAFAHSRGVIHRDLKPQNVMVGEFGEVYVMDWGIDVVRGTTEYRAPEAQADARSDLYSLGALMIAVLREPTSPALKAIAAKCMREEPAERYPSAMALLADIDRFEAGERVEAWSEPLWHRLQRFGSRNAILLWLLAAYVAAKFVIFFLRAF